ncbi:MAG: hypothetical protein WA966_13520 [Ornithinimicrobium sp.]
MLPSSLIFAVILAVWAAYLMQHWVRRRDHIATARSVDRFSEAMRVLERRQRRPHLDLSEPTARSYAVSLTRPGAPDVVVKRAQPSASVAPAPVVPVAREVTPRKAVARQIAATGRSTRTASVDTSVRTRGVLLLFAAAVMLIGTALGTMAVLPWWTIPVGIGVFVVALFAVRQSVRRAARSTRRARAARPSASARGSAVSAPAAVTSARSAKVGRSAAAAGGGAAAALAATIQTEGEELAAAARVAVSEVVHPRVAREVYDIDALDQMRATAMDAELGDAPEPMEAPLVPGTWQPIPVPPPTYTLKAKAHARPMLDELPAELPEDGTALSLDEEFEELPIAIRGLA